MFFHAFVGDNKSNFGSMLFLNHFAGYVASDDWN